MEPKEPTFYEEIAFEANLREFANRVGYVCSLEAGGRVSQADAYQRIRELWKQLKQSKKNLRIGDEDSAAER